MGFLKNFKKVYAFHSFLRKRFLQGTYEILGFL